jgi:hypothetical protein
VKPLQEDPALAQCTAHASLERKEGEGADIQTAWNELFCRDIAGLETNIISHMLFNVDIRNQYSIIHEDNVLILSLLYRCYTLRRCVPSPPNALYTSYHPIYINMDALYRPTSNHHIII